MAVKAINLVKTKEYQSNLDEAKGTEDATTFILGAIDSRIMSTLRDKALSMPISALTNPEGANASMNLNQVNFDVVVFGLKGLKNYQDDEGKVVVYKTDEEYLGKQKYITANRELVASFDPDLITELADAINDFNSITEIERKNSDK